MINSFAQGSQLPVLQIRHRGHLFDQLVWGSKTSHSGSIPSSQIVSVEVEKYRVQNIINV